MNYSGGDNRTHGQVERAQRIDSFDAGKLENWDVLYAFRGDEMTPLGCEHYTIYGPGDLERETINLSYPRSRWTQTLRLTRIPNGFGGSRAFWLCPRCGRRVRYLYFKGLRFICRECARLNYRSQQETKDSMRDYWKGMGYAEKHLVVHPSSRPDGFSFPHYVPDRPLWMHETTYRHHLARFLKYRERYKARLLADFARVTRPFR